MSKSKRDVVSLLKAATVLAVAVAGLISGSATLAATSRVGPPAPPPQVQDSAFQAMRWRQQVRLPLEAGEAVRVGRERLGQHLDGNVALQTWITRPVHLAHAAGTERRDDLVVTQRSTDHLAPCLDAF